MDDVLAWLLEGDVAVQYQTRRDLLDDDRPELQVRIGEEGYAAALLAARGADGPLGPRLLPAQVDVEHYTLLELRNLGVPPDHPVVRDAVAPSCAATTSVPDGGLDLGPGASDVCVNGMALRFCAWFGRRPGRAGADGRLAPARGASRTAASTATSTAGRRDALVAPHHRLGAGGPDDVPRPTAPTTGAATSRRRWRPAARLPAGAPALPQPLDGGGDPVPSSRSRTTRRAGTSTSSAASTRMAAAGVEPDHRLDDALDELVPSVAGPTDAGWPRGTGRARPTCRATRWTRTGGSPSRRCGCSVATGRLSNASPRAAKSSIHPEIARRAPSVGVTTSAGNIGDEDPDSERQDDRHGASRPSSRPARSRPRRRAARRQGAGWSARTGPRGPCRSRCRQSASAALIATSSVTVRPTMPDTAASHPHRPVGCREGRPPSAVPGGPPGGRGDGSRTRPGPR